MPGAGAGKPGGYVYFARATVSRMVKIGWTKSDPAARLRTLQVGSPEVLELEGVEPGGSGHEAALHERFRVHHSHGEWFRPGGDLDDYIRTHARGWPLPPEPPPPPNPPRKRQRTRDWLERDPGLVRAEMGEEAWSALSSIDQLQAVQDWRVRRVRELRDRGLNPVQIKRETGWNEVIQKDCLVSHVNVADFVRSRAFGSSR